MYGHLPNKIEHTCTEHVSWTLILGESDLFVSGPVLGISFRTQALSSQFISIHIRSDFRM